MPSLLAHQVFPTQNRALALGICIGMGRLGSLITPFVSQVQHAEVSLLAFHKTSSTSKVSYSFRLGCMLLLLASQLFYVCFQVMLTMSLYLTLSIYCGCCLLSAIACVMLPIETMGMGLRESTFDGDAVPSNTTNNRSSGATFSCCQGQIKPE